MEQGMVPESIWVAVGFLIFIALVWRKMTSTVASILDERSAKISDELQEAANLREEALAELKKFQRIHREAAEEAATIISSAKTAATHIRKDAEKKAADALKRQEQQADEKIRAIEASMIAELRERATNIAIATATDLIIDKLDEEKGLALVDAAVEKIKRVN